MLVTLSAWASMNHVRAETPLDLTPSVLAAMEAGSWTHRATRVSLADEGKTVEVIFPAGPSWPMVRFPAAAGDWSRFNALAVTVENPADTPIEFGVRVNNADGKWRAGSYSLPGGRLQQLHLYLGPRLMPGVKWLAPTRFLLGDEAGLTHWMESRQQKPVDLRKVASFEFFVKQVEQDQALRIRRVEAVSVELPEQRAFVDEFGQYVGDDWPWKTRTEADLASAREREEAFIASQPPWAERNAWGGWADGPQLEATGRFRVQKYEGRWWLVDPDGRLFWSSGVTGVRPQSGGPMSDRRWAFAWLPEADDPLAKYIYPHGPTEWIDFARINLHRKWGPGFAELEGDAFAELAHRRLASWGFNTVGNWSDPGVWRQRKTPYTIPIHPRVSRIPGINGRTFPDVFDDAYWQDVSDRLARLNEFKDDPWLIGVFIENELPCDRFKYLGPSNYAMAFDLLGAEAKWATKREAVKLLQKRHGGIDALNQAWGARFTSWDEVLEPVHLEEPQRERAMEDLAAITSLVWEHFSSECRRLVREHLPGALYLGMRFSTYNREAIVAQAKHCDVVTFNIYSFAPTTIPAFEEIRDLDIPVLIGEYHFHSTEGGYFGTRAGGVKSNAEKRKAFEAYLRDVLRSPHIVGAHWFTFRDQPITGRWDGENYAIGLYTITDHPYPEFRDSANRVHQQMYQIRVSQSPQPDADP